MPMGTSRDHDAGPAAGGHKHRPSPDMSTSDSDLGPYHLGECIGKGAFGSVYRGLNMQTGVTVAIKTVKLDNIPKDELVSIETEIQLLKKLKHPNIVKYIDTIRTESALHIVIEYVENGSLANLVKKFGGGFPETLVAIYISQVLKGLDFLHAQGVIHRDIKGANILATKEGLVKLADFGVATKINDSQKSDSVVGTPYWMAPEIIEMSGSQSTACDIWSVGCTIIELLTGSPPYFDLQPMPALFRIVQDEHPPLPAGASPALEDFLLLCFQKDPNMRSKAEDLLKHPWLRSPEHSDIIVNAETNLAVVADSNTEFDEVVQQTIRMYKGDLRNEIAEQAATAASAQTKPKPQTRSEREDEESAEDWDAELATEEAQGLDSNAIVHPDEINIATMRLKSGFIPAQMAERLIARQAFGTPVPNPEAAQGLVNDDGFSDMSSTGDDVTIAQTGAHVLDGWVETDDEDEFLPPAEVENEHDDGALDIDLSVVERRKNRVWDANAEDAHDAFDGFDEVDLVGDQDAKLAEEVHNLLAGLITAVGSRNAPTAPLLATIESLRSVFRKHPSQIDSLVVSQGVIPLLDIIDINEVINEKGRSGSDRVELLAQLLQLVLQIMEQSPRVQQSLCLVGIIPIIVQLVDKRVPLSLRCQIAQYVRMFCSAPSKGRDDKNPSAPNLTRQIFIACGGLNCLVSLVTLSPSEPSASNAPLNDQELTLIVTGVECIQFVFDTPTNPKNDFCRLFCKAGLLRPLSETLLRISASSTNLELVHKSLNVMLIFAERGDGVVKGYLAKKGVLDVLLKLLDILPESGVIIVLKIIRHMTMEVQVRDELEAFGAIPKLVSLLDSPVISYTNQILPAMYYLFRIKASRQEQMALCGIIPLLQRNIVGDSHLKQFALPMICKFAHTSARVRQELKKYAGIQFYLTLLTQPYWQMQAIDSIAVWLAEEGRRVELVLKQNHNLHKLVQLFADSDPNVFGNILRSLSKIISLSPAVNKALGQSGTFLAQVVYRLSTSKPIIQKPLLMMIRLLFECYTSVDPSGSGKPRAPKLRSQMGYKQGLEHVLRDLAKEDGAVLVQDLAVNLIKDFYGGHDSRKS
ncbi:non-specific serine/threonine protein kinase [Plasmodiophora brassicae]|uniref:non-specific serine/threonine protein kinase n=1 Tax=Plasmodiophora brassicae TaxID=37360 RepID=A0A2L2BM95_PLABS|nr:MAPKKK5 [Plasmodiophora brassicae]SPQ96539.1 unnamed protein product [Plasmodiophora brassicae]